MFPDELHKVMAEQQKLLKAQVPVVIQSLSLYLANDETEHILFRPCRVCWQVKGVHMVSFSLWEWKMVPLGLSRVLRVRE